MPLFHKNWAILILGFQKLHCFDRISIFGGLLGARFVKIGQNTHYFLISRLRGHETIKFLYLPPIIYGVLWGVGTRIKLFRELWAKIFKNKNPEINLFCEFQLRPCKTPKIFFFTILYIFFEIPILKWPSFCDLMPPLPSFMLYQKARTKHIKSIRTKWTHCMH